MLTEICKGDLAEELADYYESLMNNVIAPTDAIFRQFPFAKDILKKWIAIAKAPFYIHTQS